jgi:hypothetical protein
MSKKKLEGLNQIRADTAIFSAYKATWNTTALYFFAGVGSSVAVVFTRG